MSDSTRLSWNHATRQHNAHKGDQAAFLRGGGDTLFSEELELLGELRGKRLVHLQCNAGQDTLCLARRGADATGVDLSDGAIAFARELSAGSGIPARFVHSEVVTWLSTTDERFDLAFASYGVLGWLPDIDAWARGVLRVLRPGGSLVYVEFHPAMFTLGEDRTPSRDDYFHRGPYLEPVGDYVGESGPSLGVRAEATAEPNPHIATSWQWGMAEVLDAIARAGLVIERVQEWPHVNGLRPFRFLVPDGNRWVWPPGSPRLPLMYGLRARRP